jgi:photosystem II stability/assembly factor-like uncharacterized protein
MSRLWITLLVALPFTLFNTLLSQEKAVEEKPAAKAAEAKLGALEWRTLGPANAPGRIGDIAVNPRNRNIWYVVASSGNLWKTTNRGLTWKPIFDNYGSYSIGCVTLDPANPDVVWLGTGENQSQRSVGFGDGVYKSTDGGETWTNVGLRTSEHIARILVDPRNSNVVYVASQGPLWAPGGERGLYKTTDGGKTWKPILQISENTGVTEAVFDPQNPDVIYAASYQRRRNVGVLIGGGPESRIYKSEDGGASWSKLTQGLPTNNLGRVALAVSPQKNEVVYALFNTSKKSENGFYRSADGGQTWTFQKEFHVLDWQYFGKLYPDPRVFDRVYIMDINVQVTNNGGKTIESTGWRVHSDNHALAFDPSDPQHIIVGNDGGLYETYDGGRTFNHFNNMSTMQFYRVAVDNAVPFYNVLGGAQDNGTVGGPSRALSRAGIRTSEWLTLGGGDGFQARVDPVDTNIFYSQSQNGVLSRGDKRTGASQSIRPGGGKGGGGGGKGGGKEVRWNWDSPLIISPHAPTRLYFAGSKLYKSDDRGDNWSAISPDLTRNLDPMKIPVMGKLWGDDAVSRNTYTTSLSVCSALSESPREAGLLYFGTDDGLVQVSEDDGKNWRKSDTFPDVPDQSHVSSLCASHHDVDTVYLSLHNYLRGDFKPYVLKSIDRGKTWTSITNNLPERGPVWSLEEDHVNKDLLFAGTEFGLFCSVDGGKSWLPLKNGMPTVSARDVAIQRRENDLVIGTFGRGFYVLDDYTPLRHMTADNLAKSAVLFPPRKTYRYYEDALSRTLPGNFATPNPPYGAYLSYHIGDLAEATKGKAAKLVLSISNDAGKLISVLSDCPSTPGLHRVVWDLRSGNTSLAKGGGKGGGKGGFGGGDGGFGGKGGAGFGGKGGGGRALVEVGQYKVTLGVQVGADITPLGQPVTLELISLLEPNEATKAPPKK